jgi:alpha-tubulin suppressor-like RCC1 family protein
MRARRTRPGRWLAGGVLVSLAGLGSLAAAPASAAPARSTPSVAAGNAHSCVLHHGRAYCWGENDFGQLGNGSTAASSIPVPVDTGGVLAGRTLTQISAGGGGGLDTCALDSGGRVYCWGSDSDGGLGDGSDGGSSSVPVAVTTSGALAGKTITQVSTGSDGGCVLDSAGAAFCWGDNDFGELGDGGTASSSVPVAVRRNGVLAGQVLTQVTAGLQDTCALDRAGAAFCWGDNGFLELGDGGSEPFSAVPVAVDRSGVLAGQSLTQISAGWQYECALDAVGTAFCWGSGALGQAGTTASGVPVAVNASGVLAGQSLTQVSVGFGAACALNRAGAAFCWGDNGSGELGNSSTVSSAAPVAVDARGVLAGKTLTQITAGAFHNCAADTAGAAYCWGDNNQGDLGNGSTVQSNVPVLAGPQAPAEVTAVPGQGTATVSWRTPARLDGGAVTGYTATAAPGGAACSTTGATTCALTGLAAGVAYRVTVVAHTTVGDSGASAPVIVTPRSAGGSAGPIVSGARPALCVTDSDNSAASGTKVVIGPCDGSAAQDWTVDPDGTIRIHGQCLDLYRSGKASKTPVDLFACTGGPGQQWQPRAGTLVNPASGRCLDDPRLSTVAGTQLEIYTCDASAGQRWKLP